MLESLAQPDTWISLLTLAGLEIVLGIDNIVFIAIMADRVDPRQKTLAYNIGLVAALSTRLLLLLTLSWIMGLTAPLFHVLERAISGRDLILLCGGLFLIYKSTHEIYSKLEGPEEGDPDAHAGGRVGLVNAVVQIMILDIVFSLDSVITAVGMAQQVWIMATAMVIAVCVMLVFAQRVGDFVTRHPSMKVLALSFLLLIGVLLVAEGFGEHIPKGYVYFAMAFSLGVELLNMRVRKTSAKPVRLHEEHVDIDPRS